MVKTIVEIPHLPDPTLNPNRRVHWGALADAKRNAKQEMMYALVDNDNPVHIPDEPYEAAILKIEFVAGFKDRQRKNRDIPRETMAIHHAGIPALPPVSIAASRPPTHSAPIITQPQYPNP